ncbi:MAG: hypothetical protein Q9169_001420, partial [Polycauliona sp. 2 TL-2023]
VAVDRTHPCGLVLGIDVIPAQPPSGVSTIQGNFLSPAVQGEVKKFLRAHWNTKRQHSRPLAEENNESRNPGGFGSMSRGHLEQAKHSKAFAPWADPTLEPGLRAGRTIHDLRDDRLVDVVLSDMSAPWEQTEGFWKRSLSDPYYRMMNTSGINFRDHAGSMVDY